MVIERLDETLRPLAKRLADFFLGLKRSYLPFARDQLQQTLQGVHLISRTEFEAQQRVLEQCQRTLSEVQTKMQALERHADTEPQELAAEEAKNKSR